MNIFENSWKGQASLSEAFWLVCVATWLVMSIILSMVISLAAPAVHPLVRQNLLLVFMLPYTLFAGICVWRCGKNAWIGWSIATKILVIFAFLISIFAVVQLFY